MYTLLKEDPRIEDAFLQYNFHDITLAFGDKNELMIVKYPTPKATKTMSYGVMPRIHERQIV